MNDDNTEAADDSTPFIAKPRLELVKPAAEVEAETAASPPPIVEQKPQGLGAAPKPLAAPPPGLPTNILADWTILTNLQLYLNQVNADASGLLADASVL